MMECEWCGSTNILFVGLAQTSAEILSYEPPVVVTSEIRYGDQFEDEDTFECQDCGRQWWPDEVEEVR